MRKSIFLGCSLLAIAGLWTGCSNDQEVKTPGNPQAISFRVQGSTPVLRTTATTPAYVNAFVVYGTDNVSNNAAGKLIFEGVTVARQAGTDIQGNFDYNPKKYFTDGAADAGFFAYSPVSILVKNMAMGASGLLTDGASFTYAVPVPDETGKTTQEDFLIATTATPVAGTTSQTITLAFDHALARIFVKAINGLSETVVIDSLKLWNLNAKGTLQIDAPNPPATSTFAWGWTAQDSVINYPYILAPSGVAVQSGVTTPTLITSMEQGMMVLPQETVNQGNDAVFDRTTDFALEVTYSVANIKMQKEFIVLADKYEFEAGKQYAINITFGQNSLNLIEINFSVNVTDFQDIENVTPLN